MTTTITTTTTVAEQLKEVKETYERQRRTSASDASVYDRVAELETALKRERSEKERALDALIYSVGKVRAAKQLGIVSSTSNRVHANGPSPRAGGNAARRAVLGESKYLLSARRKVAKLRQECDTSHINEKKHALSSMKIMEWTKDRVIAAREESDGDAESGSPVMRELDYDEQDIVAFVPPKDIARRELEDESDEGDHIVLSFALAMPVSPKWNESVKKALIVIVLHIRRGDDKSTWFEIGRTEPRPCLWPANDKYVLHFLRSVALSVPSDVNVVARTMIRATICDVGEIAECFGALPRMRRLGTASIMVQDIRRARHMTTQVSVVPVASPTDSSMMPEKDDDETVAVTKRSGAILQLTMHSCSWPLLKTPKMVTPVQRVTYVLPQRSNHFFHVSEHLYEAPMTVLIPCQLLGLYILRISGTLSFLRQKLDGAAKRDERLEKAFEMQMNLLEDYKAAAKDLVVLGDSWFKSYKRRSECDSTRFVPNNCFGIDVRVQDGDCVTTYSTITFAAPAIGAAVPIPNECIRDVKDIAEKQSCGLRTFGKKMRAYSKRASKFAKLGRKVPQDLSDKMTALSHASARRRDIVFAHILCVAISSFRQTVRAFGHSGVFWRQVRPAGFLLHVESLLTTYAYENAQLEDVWDAMEMLRSVSIRVIPTSPRDMPVRILFRRRHYIVELVVPEELRDGHISNEAYGKPIKIVPVLITQGVDEMETYAHRFETSKLQDAINKMSIKRLSAYVRDVSNNVDARVDVNRISELLETLIDTAARTWSSRAPRDHDDDALDVERRKNVDLLLLSARISRELRGGRATVCSEGCGRTSMSVTLEQAILLRLKHGLHDEAFYDVLRTIRTCGIQRTNVSKNTGSRMYKLSSLQRALLPSLLRPPMGTFFSG